VIVGLDTKPALLWNGNSASGIGVRYAVVEVTQYMTADGRRRQDVFVVWRQRDGAAFRRRIGAADTLSGQGGWPSWITPGGTSPSPVWRPDAM
jgi:hypothetical protein